LAAASFQAPILTVAVGKLSDLIPLVSVVMPVYNGEEYIAEAIQSILAQTFADFE